MDSDSENNYANIDLESETDDPADIVDKNP